MTHEMRSECDDCEYARAETDPYATGDSWYVEYYCTLKQCVDVEAETETEPQTETQPESEN